MRVGRQLTFTVALFLILEVFIHPPGRASAQDNQAPPGTKSKTLAEINDLINQAFQAERDGRFDLAMQLNERALALAEREVGPETYYVALALSNMALLHAKKGDAGRAEALYLRAIAILEKSLGAGSFFVAQTLGALGDLYSNRDDMARAEATYRRALAIAEKAPGQHQTVLAYLLTSAARLYRSKGDVKQAEPLLQRATLIAEKIPDAAARTFYRDSVLREAAQLYELKGDHERAERSHQQLIALREQTYGPEHPELAFPLDRFATFYKEKDDFARAEQTFRRALAIREKAFGAEHPEVAVSLTFLGQLYVQKADYKQAEDLLRRALAIREKAYGAEHPFVATTLNSLAILYAATNDLEQAEQLYRRVLAMKEKEVGLDHPTVATLLTNLARLLYAKGEYVRAEPLYERALAIREKRFGPDHPDVASTLSGLAQLLLTRGDDERAAQLYRRALKIHEITLGPEHTAVAAILGDLALYHGNKKEYAEAERLFERALAIEEKTYGAEHPAVATTLSNLAVYYHDKGDYARAEHYIRRALAIREKTLGAGHADVALALNNLAAVCELKGDYRQAKELYERALELTERTLGPEHPRVPPILQNLTLLSYKVGDAAQAVAFLARSAEIQERHLSLILSAGSERQKILYAATLASETDYAVWFHLFGAARDERAADLALTTILRRKGRALDAMSDQIAALRRRLDPEGLELLGRLDKTRSQLAALTLKGPGGEGLSEHRAEVARLDAEAQRIEAAISARSAAFRAQARPVSLAGVQAAIPEAAALVEIVSYRPYNVQAKSRQERWGASRYAAYVLRRKGLPAKGITLSWVDLGEAAPIEAGITRLRAALGNPRNEDAKAKAATLYEMVFRPVVRLLGEARMVLLSPDGALNLVPFGALVDEQGRHLAERYTITYLTSGRDLLRLQVRAESRQGPVVIADPDFGEATRAAAERLLKQAGSAMDFSSVYFSPLPGTAKEARALGKLLPDAQVLTEAAATEAAVKRVAGPSILHIATHGFFLEDVVVAPERAATRGMFIRREQLGDLAEPGVRVENPLLRSGLGLAGANLRAGGAGDGVLTALEATGLDLWGTKLAVLSACQTGLGEVKNGDGVYGLRRALVLAGAEGQLMSLWQVDDKATKDLMVGYYRRLQAGEGRAEALRQVQLGMLKSKTWSHPYYWASFIPVGQWASLNGKN